MAVISIKSRLKRLEQRQINPTTTIDLTKLSNQQLIAYHDEVGKHKITTGIYKGRKLKDLSNQELAAYKKELLAMKGIN